MGIYRIELFFSVNHQPDVHDNRTWDEVVGLLDKFAHPARIDIEAINVFDGDKLVIAMNRGGLDI